jgi:type IV pilus assembly protein PilW
MQSNHRRIRSAGFSLVEIMVGMVIGMLGIIVIMQMFAVFEDQKRTTTSGDDAQNGGAIALYGLQRNIQQSGYGISALNLIGCNVTLPSGATIALAPLTINPASIPAGDNFTDTLLIAYGNGDGSVEGEIIGQPSSNNLYPVNTPSAFVSGVRVIAEPSIRPTSCDTLPATLVLDTVNGNIAASSVPVTTGQAGVANGALYNLGASPKVLAYRVTGGNLTVCDYMVNNCGDAANANNTKFWVPVASDIVSLRAQYGQDTTGRSPVTAARTNTMDGILDGYSQVTPTDNCGWVRTSAVRLVLVARGGQFNKTDPATGLNVTTTAPTWSGSAGAPINLSADGNWQNYRYKVFETTVPLRNVTWMGVQTQC